MVTPSEKITPAAGSSGIRPDFSTPKGLTIVAHQGVQGKWPGNSYAAIDTALGWAESVEFDTYSLPLDKDPTRHEVVIIHPEGYYFYVNRSGMNNDAQMPISYEQLRSIQVDSQPLVPTLREILDCYQDRCALRGTRTRLEIELKGPNPAEAVVPIIQEYVANGKISYSDIILCAFKYPNEPQSRLEIARSLNAEISLSLSFRGGDFSQDAFGSYDEVFAYAKSLNIEWLDVTRRNLTPEIVDSMHQAGFKVTCHHLRTSDELACARRLGVDSIRADQFYGPNLTDYPKLKIPTATVFSSLQKSGAFKLTDWIWEFSRSVLSPSVPLDKLPLLAEDQINISASAVVRIKETGTVSIIPCEGGTQTNYRWDLSNTIIGPKLLSDFELHNFPEGSDIKHVLNDMAPFNFVSSHLSSLACLRQEVAQSLNLALKSLSFDDFIAVVENKDSDLLSRINPPLEEEEYRAIADLFHYSLVRSGRILGMLAAIAAQPLSNERGDYLVELDSGLMQSETIRQAATEQCTAQSLRSGNRIHLTSERFAPFQASDISSFDNLSDVTTLQNDTISDDLSLQRLSIPHSGEIQFHTHIPEVVAEHLQKHPYSPPLNVADLSAWFEGSYNPVSIIHLLMIRSVLEMGFKTVIVGTVPLNPHKPKDQIQPLDERLAALESAIRYEGLPITDSINGNGVYITKSAFDFHKERLKSWLLPSRRVLMGPDNFDTYYTENRPWALFAAHNPIIRYLTRFRGLYNNLLSDRILVFDRHYKHHATDIREGRAEMHPAVAAIFGNRFRVDEKGND